MPGFRFGMVKVFLDGVVEHPAQTAALLDPYLDGQGGPAPNRGGLRTSAADYGRLGAAFNRAGRCTPTDSETGRYAPLWVDTRTPVR
ncbi:hypothetical protein [Streptomyces sp. NBC_01276]|uniref:hypothetical protein n=1 Tax=Streptomyces sp. NBC_01276 TaxID=2903808 RepID=UPI00352EDC83